MLNLLLNCGIFVLYICSVGGVKVSMVAFQAVDPGSIPGRRSVLFLAEYTNGPYGNRFAPKWILCYPHFYSSYNIEINIEGNDCQKIT